MALVKVEVVGRPLILGRGPTFCVGEKMALDDAKSEHVDIIRRGWVRLVPTAPTVPTPATASFEKAPKNKMVRRKSTRRKRTT